MNEEKLSQILAELKKITSFIDEIKQQKQLGSSLVEEQAEVSYHPVGGFFQHCSPIVSSCRL